MKAKWFSIFSTVLVLAVALSVAAPASAQPSPDLEVGNVIEKSPNGIYIVQMADKPVVAYEGDIKGLKATKPEKDKKINPNSAAVKDYVSYLVSKHDETLAKVNGKKVRDYVYSYNGFAAELTEAQALSLSKSPLVLSVEADVLMQMDTSRTPDFLRLTEPGGLWEQLGGSENAGEGVIVGIIDSGIWPENPSFSDRDENGKLVFRQIPGWHGRCRPGEGFPASDCNQKLIAAQWFNSGWGGDAGTKATFPYEFISARDADGHGSHTASTAAGNYGVNAVIDGIDLGYISGMAPRARIAAYKVCWGISPDGGCFGSDSVAAIDQAVADGVDVLNFSISGTGTNYLDAVEVAFLFAADAGVFVAASAGNSGPGAGTVAHMSPWLTTVAAGTKDDYYAGTVTLGNGEVYAGASRTTAVSGDLVYSADVVLAGADPNEGRLCYPGTLDPALVTGKIVACDRGVIARVDKSLAVAMAGGIGSVLMNTGPSSLNADLHSIPTVHVDHVDGAAIRVYAQTSGATASLVGNDLQEVEAPFVAEFSSRGPNQAGGDLLKPDIMAPGVDVLAAVSPYSAGGKNWDFYSGTSMSSPHMAGLAALLIHAHPDWSPMMVKSAFMTTATTMTNENNPIPGGPFAYGAGQVVPNSAVDPGLVYDAGWVDWLGFLCGTGQLNASYCPAIGIDPSDLNYPSISIAELAGEQTVTRTVTNVGPAGTYNVSVDAPAGINVSVSPSSLTLASGESASYTVTFTNISAPVGSYVNGSLTWSDGAHYVTSPLVVRPVQLAVPAELGASGPDGALSYDVSFGYNGDFTAAAHGLVPSTQQNDTVVDDPANDINVALSTGVGVNFHLVAVPAGSAYTRISLFDDYTDGSDDLDLYVWTYPGFSFVGSSGSGTSAEQVDIAFPTSEYYFVAVHGWQTDGPDASYTLFDWSVSATPGGSLSLDSAPAAAVIGAPGSIDISWSGLAADQKYLGAVSYADAGGLFGLTLISVDTD
jgi:hypothetical protein